MEVGVDDRASASRRTGVRHLLVGWIDQLQENYEKVA
jgi:hypothetical protein